MWNAAAVQAICDDLSAFTDIGTEPPEVTEITRDGWSIIFFRNGELVELRFPVDSSLIVETTAERRLIKHASFKALLASERYGHLKEWAAKQKAFLDRETSSGQPRLETLGLLNSDMHTIGIADIDDLLIADRTSVLSARLILIDGPAGIGKTQVISDLCLSRAANYLVTRRPLILHVQSRGRALSYIPDLMAFSLQRLRVLVTFDQVPTLVKHGLVMLAIDGFDELADPDGYDNAWNQINDLRSNIRGEGSLILAGRETFIGRDRVLREIKTLKEGVDEVNVYTLQPPSKGAAIRWLRDQGWNDWQLAFVEDYLEPRSLALRPFFLRKLSEPAVAEIIGESESTSVLGILMDAMIDRETEKFGSQVDLELSVQHRRDYVVGLMAETARDMAEGNTLSISDSTLAWLVEVVVPEDTGETLTRLLKARSQNLAFLTNDDRAGFRTFYHEKFYEYFLSVATIEMVLRGEVGRVLSRNILGASFLETFGDVMNSISPSKSAEVCRRLIVMLGKFSGGDRTRRNLGALAIACLSLENLPADFTISDVHIDECRIVGTSIGGHLQNTTIQQLDCRGANLGSITFAALMVNSVIADEDTLLPEGFPIASAVKDVTREGTIFDPELISSWLTTHSGSKKVKVTTLIPERFECHPAVSLLQKACRSRRHWLRRSDDV